MWRSVPGARAGLTAILAGLLLSGCGGDGQLLPSAPTSTGSLSADDGYIADSVSPFDESLPAVSRLDGELRDAVQAAAVDAEAEDIELRLTSAWRSKRYQQALLDEAIREHGSREEGLKWAATPETSKHVSGDAVDVGPTDAGDWLIRHGEQYGLCQIYANEPWHFELAGSDDGHCPDLKEDAASG